MKPLYSIFAAVMLFGTIAPPAQAEVQVSVDFFHEQLEPYGDWMEVGDYGYCWQPRDVDRDWRPYSDGRWLYTDAGWTWDSEEPYSWAVYHYGRWVRVDEVGWVWVPGTEWGPGWVSWRRSPRHVGWAPLPPDAEFDHSAGFSSRVDADYDIGPAAYNFVDVRNFGSPRLRLVFVQPRENYRIINETTNITRITYVNNVVYNEGPRYDVISRESSLPIRRLRLDRREALDGDPRSVRAEHMRAKVEGDSLRVTAPSFNARPATAPRKVAARVEKDRVDRGWKNAGPPAEVEKLRAKIKSEPAAPVESAQPVKGSPAVVKPVTTAQPAPPVSVPDKKPAKGKVPKAPQVGERELENQLPPVPPESAPGSPTQPAVPAPSGKTGKPNRGPKPPQPEASPRPAPPAPEEVAPPTQRKPSKQKLEPSRRPASAPQAPTDGAKRRQVPDNGKAPPETSQPETRSVEPKTSKPRAEPRSPQPTRPAPQVRHPEPTQVKHSQPSKVQRPQVPQTAPPTQSPPNNGKAKGKDRNDKKEKPEDETQ